MSIHIDKTHSLDKRDKLRDLVISKNADGIDIDFELLPTNQRENLVLFMEELSFAFHSEMEDPIITMATPEVYQIDIVGHSATVYYVSGFVADDTAPAFADA